MILPLLILSVALQGYVKLPLQDRPTARQIAQLRDFLTKVDRPDLAAIAGDPKTKFRDDSSGDRFSLPFVFSGEREGVYGSVEVLFDRRTDTLVGLTSIYEKPPTKEVKISDETLERRAREFVARLFPGADLHPITSESEGRALETPDPSKNRKGFGYYRIRHGLRSYETYGISFDRENGRILGVGSSMSIDGDTHGADPRLDEETLKSIALGFFADARPFAQGEISTSEFRLWMPQSRDLESGAGRLAERRRSSLQIEAYKRLEERRVVVPLYSFTIRSSEILSAERPVFLSYWVVLDARDGTLLRGGVGSGLGSGEQGGKLAELPTRASVGSVAGDLSPLDMTSFTPPGLPATVTSGGKTFAGRFEAGQGTLWLRKTTKAPYRAFRPEPGLRDALRRSLPR